MADAMPELPPASSIFVGPLYNFQLVAFFIAFTGIALFNCIEVIITTLLSFQRRQNWYFASLLIAASGTIIYQCFVFAMIYDHTVSIYAVITLLDVGWYIMVGGQSMILWSRLHLVCFNRKLLKGVLYMIIIVTTAGVITELTLALRAIHGGVIDSLDPGFNICEKVVVIVCCLQEFVISCIYIYCTFNMLRGREMLQKNGSRRKMKELLAANFFIIILDITLVALEFAALWGIWCTFKGVVYSIKIKVEFAILTNLKRSLRGGERSQVSYGGGSTNGRPSHPGTYAGGAGIERVDAYALERRSHMPGGMCVIARDDTDIYPDGSSRHHHSRSILRTTKLSVDYNHNPIPGQALTVNSRAMQDRYYSSGSMSGKESMSM